MAPKGIQLQRKKGWRKPPNAVVVSRPSRWGNPWEVGSGYVGVTGSMRGPGVGFYSSTETFHYDLDLRDGITAEEAVWLYEVGLEASLSDPDPFYDELRAALEALRGHDLACWCALDAPCHRDPLLRLANK